MSGGLIVYKTKAEIEQQRESSLLVARTLAEVAKRIGPGVTSLELDKLAEEFIRDHGAIPAFKGYNGFPASLCVSPNSEVVHGIPNNKPFKEGDIVSVDCGVLKNEYYGDSAYTFPIGDVSDAVRSLLRVTKESLYQGINAAVEGKRLQDISFEIQTYCESHGYSVVRELVGHGIGRQLHEAPEVPNFGKRGSGPKLKQGLVIAIEPMINMGTEQVIQASDNWTIITADNQPSAHFEHDVAVVNGKPEVLSTFKYIEEALAKK
jgi:methionyl aminopeptidase